MSLPVRRWLRPPKQAPTEWLLELNRKPTRIFMGILLASSVVTCGFLVTSSRVVASESGGSTFAVVSVGLCAVASLAICIVQRFSLPPAIEMSIIVGLFLAITALTSAMVPLTDDFILRSRLHAGNITLLKPVPAILGFPLMPAAFCMLWALATDVSAYEFSWVIHGDPKELRVYVSCLVSALGWFGMACLTSSRHWIIFDVQEALAAEKVLMENIVGMMCDAIVSLPEDGSTVLRTDLRLEAALGRRAAAGSFTEYLAEAECQRFRDGLERARAAPVLLPTTLVAEAGAEIQTELFIVGNRVVRGRGAKDSSPAFLIGIRCAPRQETEPQEAGLRQEYATVWAEGLEGQAEQWATPSQGDVQSALSSLPMTTATGQVFEGIDLERCSEGGASEGGASREAALRAGLERIVGLGRTEGWLIPSEDLELAAGQVLGAGSFGRVVPGSLYGSPVAVKAANRHAGGVSVKDLAALANEIRVLRHIRHPNVVTFHGACLEPARWKLMLVLERVQGPNMYEYVRSLAADSGADRRCQVLLDIACALWYLHAQRPQIIHGDLKDTNILVEQRAPRAQLLDFGLARCRTRSARALGGSLAWMAPEVICTRSEPRASADVFSFGRVALLAVTSHKPLQGMPTKEIVDRAKRGISPPVLVQLGRPLHAECAGLCERVLSFAPERRPSMAEVHRELRAWVPPMPGAAEEGAAPSAANQPPEAAGAGWQAGTRFVGALRALPGQLRARLAQLRAAGGDAAAAGAAGGSLDGDAVAEMEWGLGTVQEHGGAEAALVLPARGPTAELPKRMGLLESAMSWNFPLPRSGCCHYHAAVAEIQRVGEELRRDRCGPFLGPFNEFQCGRCGVLDREINEVCPVCFEPAATAAPSLPDIREEEEEAESANAPPEGEAAEASNAPSEEEGDEAPGARPEARCSL